MNQSEFNRDVIVSRFNRNYSGESFISRALKPLALLFLLVFLPRAYVLALEADEADSEGSVSAVIDYEIAPSAPSRDGATARSSALDEETSIRKTGRTTVITAEDIERAGKQSLVEILESAVGLQFRSYAGSDYAAQPSMRGFGENSFGRVAVFVDGARINNPDMQGINFLSVPLALIEKIEIFDGSDAVRYGSGAVGGVIAVTTKKKADGRTGGVSVTGGGNYERGIRLYQSWAPLENASLFAGVDYEGTNGFRERTAEDSFNALINGTFAFNGDKLFLLPSIKLSRSAYQMPGALTKDEYEANYKAANNYGDEGEETALGAGFTLKWSPSGLVNAVLPISYTYKDISADMVSWTQYTDRHVHTAQASPSVSLEFANERVFNKFALDLGVDFSAAFLDISSYSAAAKSDLTNAFEISQISGAPYASARLSFPFGLSAQAGARYDAERLAAKSGVSSLDESAVYQAFVYDVALSYNLFNAVEFYISYATLFRYPFTDEAVSAYGYATDYFNTSLKPENGYNAEAGINLNISRVSLSAVFYYMTLENEIAWNNYTYQNENMDKTKRLGVNAQASVTPVSWLTLSGGYSYVDARFADGDNADKIVPLVSAHSASGELHLTLPKGFFISGDVSYTGDYYMGGDLANSYGVIPGYTLVGAAARFETGNQNRKLSVRARLSNIFNTRYAPYVYYSGYYPGSPRAFSLTVALEY